MKKNGNKQFTLEDIINRNDRTLNACRFVNKVIKS